MSLLTPVLIGMAVWLLILVVITLLLVARTRHRRRHQGERRRGMDRRMGLPDPRPVRIERRRVPDRRRDGIAA